MKGGTSDDEPAPRLSVLLPPACSSIHLSLLPPPFHLPIHTGNGTEAREGGGWRGRGAGMGAPQRHNDVHVCRVTQTVVVQCEDVLLIN